MKKRGISRFLKIVALSLFFVNLLIFAPCNSFAKEGRIPVIKFKDADIKIVLQSIAQKALRDGEKVNIIISPIVEGLVSVNLENVDWFTALEAVLRSYGYSYEWVGKNIILVDTSEKIKAREAEEKERQEVEPPRTRVYSLKFVDAADAKKAIEPILSPAGRVSVLETTGKAGWVFSTDVTKRKRNKDAKTSRTKTLIVSDISKKLEEIETLLKIIDVMPLQILVKARILEVNRDFLKDIGFQWSTGSSGISGDGTINLDSGNIDGQIVHPTGSTISIWDSVNSSTPTTAGLQLAFKKLSGTDLEALLHALEEDTYTNTISAPSILTLNNQEASILVGEKYPILKTEVSTETGQVTGGSLDYYQDIGIQLNVVPQVSGKNNEYINMIIHPAVTSLGTTVTINSSTTNGAIAAFPRINTRETETQIMLKDGETIVMGGLLKDVKSKNEFRVPFLSSIPWIGKVFFTRHTEDTAKIDLLIFITAYVIKPGEAITEDIMQTTSVISEFGE